MTDDAAAPHRRRPRYPGRNPRRFDEKYKEHAPDAYPETIAKVLASGKTPAGTHVPVMVREVLGALEPAPGEVAVDCTLGYGGHARQLLPRLLPGGFLLGLDVDPIELPKTEARLRAQGFGPDELRTRRSNFAGLPQALAAEGLAGADCILADLGVSSMQLDAPDRGFSMKASGPLDMRMNPRRGQPASIWLERVPVAELEELLVACADEPRARQLASALAGQRIGDTAALAAAVRRSLPRLGDDERELAVRRVFQAIRVAVNEEFTALDALLRHLPRCLNPGGRGVILSFHSGEDRRVKKAFQAGLAGAAYESIAEGVVRPTPQECRANPRAKPAKLRWARRGR